MTKTIWGILDIQDAQTPVTAVGQTLTYEAIQQFVAAHNTRVQSAITTFVDGTPTTDVETYFETPGGGMMQEADRITRPGAVKRSGRYNVAFPIRDARDQIAGDDITLAYMTLAQLQTHISNVFIRHLNWIRHHVLRALFNNANETSWEELVGRDITIRRLANTDGTIYPPNVNADAGAEDNHYLVSGYLSSAISDTNNPFPVLRQEIEEHEGEGEVVVFINSAQSTLVKALADFTEFDDPRLSVPITATVIRGTAPSVPGLVIGRCSRCWVVEWNSIPADYMVAIDISQSPPLRKRIDVPATIPGRGVLALVARQEEYPLQESFWRDRHGYGVANRTSAAIMQFKASGNYDVPTTFA